MHHVALSYNIFFFLNLGLLIKALKTRTLGVSVVSEKNIEKEGRV